MLKAAADKILKKAGQGPSISKNQHDSARRGFLIGGTLAATSLCLVPPVVKAAKLLRSNSVHDSALSILGEAYAGLATSYRLQSGTPTYTARELRCNVEGHALTRFELNHRATSGESETERIAVLRQEIEKLASGMDLAPENVATATGHEFEPTLLLYHGRVYTDESLLQAVRPLCAAVAGEHKMNFHGVQIRAITLSPKGRAGFHPQVVIT